MILTLAFMLPATPLAQEKNAREAESNRKYIKELKIFSKEGGTEADAKAWCDSQDENKGDDDTNNWAVIPGNLNDGASGALKKDVRVFLCYRTTSDSKEAIRDI